MRLVLKDVDIATTLEKLSEGQTQGVNLLNQSALRSKSGDYVPVIGVVVAMLTMVHSAFNTDNVSAVSGAEAFATVNDLAMTWNRLSTQPCLRGTDPVKLAEIVSLARTICSRGS